MFKISIIHNDIVVYRCIQEQNIIQIIRNGSMPLEHFHDHKLQTVICIKIGLIHISYQQTEQ